MRGEDGGWEASAAEGGAAASTADGGSAASTADGGSAASTADGGSAASTAASTEAFIGLAAHESPSGSGLGRSGDPTGDRMPIPMATRILIRLLSSRHPPSCLSPLLHRP